LERRTSVRRRDRRPNFVRRRPILSRSADHRFERPPNRRRPSTPLAMARKQTRRITQTLGEKRYVPPRALAAHGPKAEPRRRMPFRIRRLPRKRTTSRSPGGVRVRDPRESLD
jgi:hypothetical protein